LAHRPTGPYGDFPKLLCVLLPPPGSWPLFLGSQPYLAPYFLSRVGAETQAALSPPLLLLGPNSSPGWDMTRALGPFRAGGRAGRWPPTFHEAQVGPRSSLSTPAEPWHRPRLPHCTCPAQPLSLCSLYPRFWSTRYVLSVGDGKASVGTAQPDLQKAREVSVAGLRASAVWGGGQGCRVRP
jgi:hypothetical protein